MDEKKTLNCEKSSEQNASCTKENVTENLNKIRSREVSTTIELEQQAKDICREREDVKDKPDDIHTRSNVKNDQQAEILAQLYEADLYFPSLKEKKKIMKHEAVSRKNPVKIRKNIIFGRVEKDQRRRTKSLRPRPLQILTDNKCFSQTDRCFELSYKSNKSQSELQDLQDKSRIADEGEEDPRNESLGSFVTKTSFLNIFDFQPASLNRSQEVSTNKNQPSSCSALSLSAPIIPYVTATESQSPKVKSAKEVWTHFIWFLQANKESIDVIMTDDISRENMETSECTNHSLKDPTKIARDSTSESLVEPIKTETDYVTTEISNNLKREISATRDAHSVSVLKLIQQIRFHILKKIIRFEKLMRSIKVDGQQENMVEKIKCLTDAKDLQKKSQLYLDILCDHQKIFNFLKQKEIYSRYAENNLSNPTSLTDLPLSATDIRTFSSLFLYQHKSLYSEVPIENIFKRINSQNYVLTYRRYRERKAIHESERKMSENVAIKLLVCFNVSLEECRLKMKQEISHSENMSLEDYQNYFNDLRIGITENLNCLKELLSAGSSVVFPVVNYLSESRIKTLQKLLFLDKGRPDVFP